LARTRRSSDFRCAGVHGVIRVLDETGNVIERSGILRNVSVINLVCSAPERPLKKKTMVLFDSLSAHTKKSENEKKSIFTEL
jgi:hypothetical protein